MQLCLSSATCGICFIVCLSPPYCFSVLSPSSSPAPPLAALQRSAEEAKAQAASALLPLKQEADDLRMQVTNTSAELVSVQQQLEVSERVQADLRVQLANAQPAIQPTVQVEAEVDVISAESTTSTPASAPTGITGDDQFVCCE